jgi:predicted ATPase
MSEGLTSEFPPLKTLDKRTENLPEQLTSFVGREEELLQIKNILKATRILTLKGPGGSGKTRLAIKTGRELTDEFSDGVRFIDLTSIRDHSLIPLAVASVLTMEDSPVKDEVESVINFLRLKEILIIIDNCEHVVSAASELAEKLVTYCPKLKIIATSREALNCRGEIVYNVLPLKLPGTESINLHEKLIQYEAVRLFIDRALAADPGFSVNNDNAAALAGICHQLEGIPLAIELAAAKIKVISLEKMYERLNDRFRFLTGGNRTAYPRQQTLKSMMDWSYDLLTMKEKSLFRKLSIFSGGCTLEAAEQICTDENTGLGEILDLLSNLTDKSLLNYVKETERYRMLETLREYGETKLFEEGELENVILKHLNYYTDFAYEGSFKLTGPDQIEWKKMLEAEDQNFQLALTSSITRDQRIKGIHLAVSLGRYWEIRGSISTGKKWFEELIDTGEEIPLTDKARAFLWLGTYEWLSENNDKAQSYYELSCQYYTQSDNKKGIAVALNNMGLVANARSDYKRSLRYAEESLEIIKETGDISLTADAIMNLATIVVNLKEYDYAESLFNESLSKYKQVEDIRGEAMTLSNLGNLFTLKKEYETAIEYLEKSLRMQREIGDTRVLPTTLRSLGVVLNLTGSYELAAEALQESLRLSRELKYSKDTSHTLNVLGYLKYMTGDYSTSMRNYSESLRLQIDNKDNRGVFSSLIGIAEVIGHEDPVRATLLTGAADELAVSVREDLEDGIESRYERLSENLKGKLGESEYILNFIKGKGYSFEDVKKLLA